MVVTVVSVWFALFQFCHTYSEIDAWELESLGFQRCKTATKLRVLKVCAKDYNLRRICRLVCILCDIKSAVIKSADIKSAVILFYLYLFVRRKISQRKWH